MSIHIETWTPSDYNNGLNNFPFFFIYIMNRKATVSRYSKQSSQENVLKYQKRTVMILFLFLLLFFHVEVVQQYNILELNVVEYLHAL
jgi:hypothetical protein